MAARVHHQYRISSTALHGVSSTHIDSGMHFGRHWHDAYGFGVLLRGGQVSASGRGTVEAVAGDVITHHPGEVHDGRPCGSEVRCWQMVHLEPHALAELLDDTSGAVHLTLPVIRDKALSRGFAALFASIDMRRMLQGAPAAAGVRLAFESALVRCCHEVVRRTQPGAPVDRATSSIKRVRERLEDEWSSPPSLAELAHEARLSRYQVLRHFERAYGVSPHAWLLARRAEAARRFIAEGFSLADASATAGFADQSHMTRVFKRQFGFTPGDWRSALSR